MSVQFTDIMQTIAHLNKIQERVKKKATPLVTQEFVKDANNLAPFDTGNLVNSSMINSDFDNGWAIWSTPYVRRLYYNPQYNFSKDSNQNAGGLWAERAKAENGKKYKAMFVKIHNMEKRRK